MRQIFRGILLVSSLVSVTSRNVFLKLSKHVGGAVGGESFVDQPELTVIDEQRSTLTGFSNAQVFVKLASRHEGVRLRKQGVEDETIKVFSFPVVHGVAVFEELYIEKAGHDYKLQFLLVESISGWSLDKTYSNVFDVVVGSPYRISVVKQPCEAFGGSPFGVQPIVGVYDRGQNLVDNFRRGKITVRLKEESHDSGNLYTFDSREILESYVFDGQAHFEGLAIRLIGWYVLEFRFEDLTSIRYNKCESQIFQTLPGPPASVILDRPIPSKTEAGLAFHDQPRIRVVDRGGNLVGSPQNRRLGVSVFFETNPNIFNQGMILPLEKSNAPVIDGVAQFKHLNINKAGENYRLVFNLVHISEKSTDQMWTPTMCNVHSFDNKHTENVTLIISTLSNYFSIVVGQPVALKIVQQPNERPIWASNLPFLSQPILHLVDAGGNIVTKETVTVEAHMTPSLSVASPYITIDTRHDPVPRVESIEFLRAHKFNLELFPGDILTVQVKWTQDIVVVLPDVPSEESIPTLELSITNSFNASSSGLAKLRSDFLVQSKVTKILVFVYEIKLGDTSSDVSLYSPNALNLNGLRFMDHWGRQADVEFDFFEMNSKLASEALEIVSRPPDILSIGTALEDGEYGAGQDLVLNVEFSKIVLVQGIPFISIAGVESMIVVLDTVSTSDINRSAHFNIQYRNGRQISLPWDATAESIIRMLDDEFWGSSNYKVSCVSRSSSTNSPNGHKWAFRFSGAVHENLIDHFTVTDFGMRTADDLSVDIHISKSLLISSTSIEWTPNDLSNIDDEMCTTRHATYSGGSLTNVLQFTYTVSQGDMAPLPITSDNQRTHIQLRRGDSVRAATSIGSPALVLANLNFPGIFLSPVRSITFDTSAPIVIDVTFALNTPNGRYAVGDDIDILVRFNKPVTVQGGVYMTLNTIPDIGVAQYLAGNTSSTIALRYTVKQGQNANILDYAGTHALSSTLLFSSDIRRYAMPSPTTIVDMTLPGPDLSLSAIFDVKVDSKPPIVVNIRLGPTPKGHYNFVFGDSIVIQIEFSAPVAVLNSIPTLNLVVNGIHRKAKFSHTDGLVLFFEYSVMVGDHVLNQNFFGYRFNNALTFEGRQETRETKVGIYQNSSNPSLRVDLNLPNIGGTPESGVPFASTISIDSSNAPPTTIVNITLVVVPPSDRLSAGDEFIIEILFSDIILWSGNSPPRLCLNLSLSGICIDSKSGSSTRYLIFHHVVTENDSTNALNWMLITGSDSAIECSFPFCNLKNENDIDVVLSFVDGSGNPTVSSFQDLIQVDNNAPKVVSVLTHLLSDSCDGNLVMINGCLLKTGDSVLFLVEFDLPITSKKAVSSLCISLNVSGANEDCLLNHRPDLSSLTKLALEYVVKEGHTTSGARLTYICSSLIDQCKMFNLSELDKIKRLSKSPIIDVDMFLPLPAQEGMTTDETLSFYVDTATIPTVVEVRSLSPNGIYRPGDIVLIQIVYSEPVVVIGIPRLEVNAHTGLVRECGENSYANALYKSGSGSKELTFEYKIMIGHFSWKLDYIDAHSLNLDESAQILQKAMHPTKSANPLLPKIPRSLASISKLVIDSDPPYITSITAINSPGIYRVDDVIHIQMEFSYNVVVSGIPALLLQTGPNRREAKFVRMKGPRTLIFDYIVMLGDKTDHLDYVTKIDLVRSSRESIILPSGAWIRAEAMTPTLDADLHLNPSLGFLEGNSVSVSREGRVLFLDLAISQRGNGYKLHFNTIHEDTDHLIHSSAKLLDVSHSIEYEVRGSGSRESGDRLGHAVDVMGDLAIIGVPHKRVPQPEIQVLQVYAESPPSEVVHEVQVITLSIDVSAATKTIQYFYTAADVGEAISGTFELSLILNGNKYSYGMPITLESDSDASQVRVRLTESYPVLGPIQVSRVSNYGVCKCFNSWTWRITMSHYGFGPSNDIQLLSTNGMNLVGNGAFISSPEPELKTSGLQGSFALSLQSIPSMITRDIAHNASSAEFKVALQEDLKVKVMHVSVSNTNPLRDQAELGRRWVVTFFSYEGKVDIPTLSVSSQSGLLGASKSVHIQNWKQGREGLGGCFTLRFNGGTQTSLLSYNSSAYEISEALEATTSINKVHVSDRIVLKETSSKKFGFQWMISFISFNKRINNYWTRDNSDSLSIVSPYLPTLEVDNHLTGWQADFDVMSAKSSSRAEPQLGWTSYMRGHSGFQVGQVAAYRKEITGQWHLETILQHLDSEPGDNFGSSVCLWKDDAVSTAYAVVGSPNKIVDGRDYHFILTCEGNVIDGHFTISIQRLQTSSIAFDASLQIVWQAIRDTLGGSEENIQVYPINSLGDNSLFCNRTFSNQIGVKFHSSCNENNCDIPEISVDDDKLVGGKISISSLSQSNHLLANAQPKRFGAAYVFWRQEDSTIHPSLIKWKQVSRLTPKISHLDGESSDNALVGWSVSISTSVHDPDKMIVLLGAPGWKDRTGTVFTFQGTGNSWEELDSLSSGPWEHEMGSEYGFSVELAGDIALISAPGYNNNTGAVYVYKQQSQSLYLSQKIDNPLENSGKFGYCVSLDKETLEALICAPWSSGGGSCHVFRLDQNRMYKLNSTLQPSNIKKEDRFGFSCSVSKNTLIAGQVEDKIIKFTPETSEENIKLVCIPPECTNNEENEEGFKIRWHDGINNIETKLLYRNSSSADVESALQELGLLIDVTKVESAETHFEHLWKVRFPHRASIELEGSIVPFLWCSAYYSKEREMICETSVSVDADNSFVRSKVHVFTRPDYVTSWVEQAYLSPSFYQEKDLFGTSIKVHNNVALVGAPNRNQFSINSGSGLFFDLKLFQDLEFGSDLYIVEEGTTAILSIGVSGKSNCAPIAFDIVSMDRNAEFNLQRHVNDIYTFQSGSELFPYGYSSIDILTESTAFGRQRPNQWVRGKFDYQGISDYKSLSEHMIVFQNEVNLTLSLISTHNQILERQKEFMWIYIFSPGMLASPIGSLSTKVAFIDKKFDAKGSFQELLSNDEIQERFDDSVASNKRFGNSIASDKAIGITVVGSEGSPWTDEDGNIMKFVGKVSIFVSKNGHWSDVANLRLSLIDMQEHAFFGSCVAIGSQYGNDRATILVGARGLGKVFVYLFDPSTEQAEMQSVLLPPLCSTFTSLAPPTLVGLGGSISISGDLAFVGAADCGAVFIFRRQRTIISESQSTYEWHLWQTLGDPLVSNTNANVKILRTNFFGWSIAQDRGRALLVGAPLAGYGIDRSFVYKDLLDNTSIARMGKGKVFYFKSAPHVQRVQFQSTSKVLQGTFLLEYANGYDSNRTSGMMNYNATCDEVNNALAVLAEVAGLLEVACHSSIQKLEFVWDVTFINNVEDSIPLFVPLWYGNGCIGCDIFVQSGPSVDATVVVSTLSMQTSFVFVQELTVQDNDSRDSFGYSLDISGNQAIIGAVHSSASPRTTWDFESGDLTGWTAMGEAFTFQPTFGDNSKHRWVYSGYSGFDKASRVQPQSSMMKGNYYVGTYEHRYDISIEPGAYVGDEPVGSLTSDPFVIWGESIRFLIGGGCNLLTVYAELLVDGHPTLRTTGKCSERMEQEEWLVKEFLGHTAQIRIMDSGSGYWDHISVDHFQFSWGIFETFGFGNGEPYTTQRHDTNKGETTVFAGCAYIFKFWCDSENSEDTCEWVEEARISASDKRELALFGFSVAIDDFSGVAMVGSINTTSIDAYHSPITIYPYITSNSVGYPTTSKLESYHKSGGSFSAAGSNFRLMPEMEASEASGTSDMCCTAVAAGSLYLFRRIEEESSIFGENYSTYGWMTTEDARIDLPGASSQDRFGYSLSLIDNSAIVGAPGVDRLSVESGAAFTFDTGWIDLQFTKREYVVMESDLIANITVELRLFSKNRSVLIGYSTSDLSARGLDASQFDSCAKRNINDRCGCGDYKHSSGEILFEPEDRLGWFVVSLIDNKCFGTEAKYVHLQLHIVGGGAINGEKFRSQLRIDDDDDI